MLRAHLRAPRVVQLRRWLLPVVRTQDQRRRLQETVRRELRDRGRVAVDREVAVGLRVVGAADGDAIEAGGLFFRRVADDLQILAAGIGRGGAAAARAAGAALRLAPWEVRRDGDHARGLVGAVAGEVHIAFADVAEASGDVERAAREDGERTVMQQFEFATRERGFSVDLRGDGEGQEVPGTVPRGMHAHKRQQATHERANVQAHGVHSRCTAAAQFHRGGERVGGNAVDGSPRLVQDRFGVGGAQKHGRHVAQHHVHRQRVREFDIDGPNSVRRPHGGRAANRSAVGGVDVIGRGAGDEPFARQDHVVRGGVTGERLRAPKAGEARRKAGRGRRRDGADES
mmetsp:Transcript_20245/g.62907  ORF Transcript_20245/g.62907 Transcript_20245/m.62907 type:complete len:343 (-) Transcript_20245:396-1424(-)